MPRWTQNELNAYLRKVAGSKPESSLCHEPLGPVQGEAPNPGRCSIRIVSCRRRWLDPDNLCVKYFIDALRYAGVIEDDTNWHIILEVSQTKVGSRNQEGTMIDIQWL